MKVINEIQIPFFGFLNTAMINLMILFTLYGGTSDRSGEKINERVHNQIVQLKDSQVVVMEGIILF
jgi:hypothetical protein